MNSIEDLPALFLHSMQSLYASEKQLMEAMPAMIGKVKHKSLQNALQHHQTISKKHISRLDKIIAQLSDKTTFTRGKKKEVAAQEETVLSKGMNGLIEEANELLQQKLGADVIDAVVIGCVQKIEHYEISAYGTAIAYATQLHLHEVKILLQETLGEEYDVDDLLTALATSAINKEALPADIEDFPREADEKKESSHAERKSPGASISERTIQSPGGRAGTSHRRYQDGESRGH